MWCYSYTEFLAEVTGESTLTGAATASLPPTATRVGDLGSTTSEFKLYDQDAALSGTLTVADTITCGFGFTVLAESLSPR
jgi:hypothetical protein